MDPFLIVTNAGSINFVSKNTPASPAPAPAPTETGKKRKLHETDDEDADKAAESAAVIDLIPKKPLEGNLQVIQRLL